MPERRPLPSENGSLAAAREWVQAHRDEGVTCPCCDQLAKVYRRKVHARMAAALIKLWRAPTPLTGAVRINDLLPEARDQADFAKLRYWGLIEEILGEPSADGNPRTGLWRVTVNGEKFIKGAKIWKYVLLYDGNPLGFDTKEAVTIRECLGDRFDYAELMRS